MINLTVNARDYLKEVITRDGGRFVTLSLKSGGCNGFTYVWQIADLDSSLNGWDGPYDDILLVDSHSMLYIFGSTIDYIKDIAGSTLAVINPMAKSSCGCGESFSA